MGAQIRLFDTNKYTIQTGMVETSSFRLLTYLLHLLCPIEDILEPVEPHFIHYDLLGKIGWELEVSCPVEVEHALEHLPVTVYEVLVVPGQDTILDSCYIPQIGSCTKIQDQQPGYLPSQ